MASNIAMRWEKLSPEEFQQLQELASCKLRLTEEIKPNLVEKTKFYRCTPQSEFRHSDLSFPFSDSNRKIQDVLKDFCNPDGEHHFHPDGVGVNSISFPLFAHLKLNRCFL